jgi:hypothetical protein
MSIQSKTSDSYRTPPRIPDTEDQCSYGEFYLRRGEGHWWGEYFLVEKRYYGESIANRTPLVNVTEISRSSGSTIDSLLQDRARFEDPQWGRCFITNQLMPVVPYRLIPKNLSFEQVNYIPPILRTWPFMV